MPRRTKSDVFVAKETFACEIDGVPTMVHGGQTRVREGHPLLDSYRDYFESADTGIQFEVEQATAAPGEKRGDSK